MQNKTNSLQMIFLGILTLNRMKDANRLEDAFLVIIFKTELSTYS